MENPFEVILEKLRSIESLLIEQNGRTVNTIEADPQKDILTISDATEYLNLSKSAIYKMTSKLTIPFYKVGKKVYFKRIELLEWIVKHRVKTREDIEKEAIQYLSRSPKRYNK